MGWKKKSVFLLAAVFLMLGGTTGIGGHLMGKAGVAPTVSPVFLAVE